MAMNELLLLDFSSESDSENEWEDNLCVSALFTKYKSGKHLYLLKRKSHGEFALTKELTNDKFRNYFRLSRDQFYEVHELIRLHIEKVGCNASRPIETEEKLAVFLR